MNLPCILCIFLCLIVTPFLAWGQGMKDNPLLPRLTGAITTPAVVRDSSSIGSMPVSPRQPQADRLLRGFRRLLGPGARIPRYVAEETRTLHGMTGSARAVVPSDNLGVSEEWAVRYSARGNGSDLASAIATDASGNVYIAGTSQGEGTGDDYVTVKYDSSGHEQWTAFYNGSGNGHDRATALAVDQSGNVYVTGSSSTIGSDQTGSATVKYDASGREQWVALHGGQGSVNEEGYAIAVDGSGNVYVTGIADDTSGGPFSTDYATIKYNASGLEEWTARYDGSGSGLEWATALALDPSGNVYVAGLSGLSFGDSGRSTDCATVKYDSMGQQQWAARYNGPADRFDAVVSIAVDAAGNVCVAGESYVSGSVLSDSNANTECLTIKYNGAGGEQWSARFAAPGNAFNGGSSIVVSDAGDIFVAGGTGSDTSSECLLLKYDGSGEEQWVARHREAGASADVAAAVSLDGSGNVYVAGTSVGPGDSSACIALKYNDSGSLLWAARHPGSPAAHDETIGIALDQSGNVCLGGTVRYLLAGSDCITISFSSGGEERWSALYNRPGRFTSGYFENTATAIALDGEGNVYVTGQSSDAKAWYASDYATVKYSAAGEELWVARYNGPGDSTDVPVALGVDAAGNVYVTGSSIGTDSSYDFATVKYNNLGEEQWVSRYDGPGHGDDYTAGLAIDSSRGLYVAGSSHGGASGMDYMVIKYDAAGGEEWVERYNGPDNGDDLVAGLAVDRWGNVYVAGSSYVVLPDPTTSSHVQTVKYDSAGQELWAVQYRGVLSAFDGAKAIAVDPAGDVCVAGDRWGNSGPDYLTLKYNFAGQEQWAMTYNGPGDGYDQVSGIAVDDSGNVVVTGSSHGGPESFTDYATVRYSASGEEQWVGRYNGSADIGIAPADNAAALALDEAGNVYVTGSASGGGPGTGFVVDCFTVKYTAAGAEDWTARFNGPVSGWDAGRAIAVDDSGNVYVAGFAGEVSGSTEFVTIKYRQSAVDGVDNGETMKVPAAYTLSQNYPNPFNPVTTIRYSLPYAGRVTISVCNILGQEVREVVNEHQGPGYHQIAFSAGTLPSGVYTYRITAGPFTETKKMILLK